jgi:4-amino-4-deoxy-L-arabinose transferase-like glycosyltransferase
LNTTPDIAAPRISWQLSLLIFVTVLLLAVPQAALLPLIDRDEPRFAEAAREMIQSGNYVVPTFNGAPRYDKPPLIYWCQAAAYELFGQGAFSTRLPSLVATAATAVLIYTWGVRLGREWIGLTAALSYSFCLQTVQQGRVATADALLIFFMTLAAFAGWLIVRPRSGTGVPLACYVVLALGFAGGFLAKGPEAWLPLIALLACGSGRRLGVTLAFLASLGLVLLWGVPAYNETHGDYLWQSWKAGIADRAWGSDQGHGASNIGVYLLELPYYFIGFWISALPWSILILLHPIRLFRGWKTDPGDTYLLFNIIPLWIIFTLMATKLPHYTLPTFPMIALLFAKWWCDAKLSARTPIRAAGGFGLGFTLLTLAAIPLAVANGYTPSPAGDLVRAAGDNVRPSTQFALVDFKEPTAVWEMRHVTTAYADLIDVSKVRAYLDQPGPHAVILSTDLFSKSPQLLDPDLQVFRARGFNAAKGKPIDLTMLVKAKK